MERVGRPDGIDVERLFRELPGGGRIPDSAGTVLRGEAGGPAEEAWIRFHLLVEGDIVKDARFEARGCPHTLATAAWLASGLPGRRCGEALGSGPQGWARALGVPVSKLGRLLIIEDALRACLRSPVTAGASRDAADPSEFGPGPDGAEYSDGADQQDSHGNLSH